MLWHILSKQFTIFAAEGGDDNADPVAKDLEVLRVSALGDEVVEGGEPLLELPVEPLGLAVLHQGGHHELQEGDECEEYGNHLCVCLDVCVCVVRLAVFTLKFPSLVSPSHSHSRLDKEKEKENENEQVTPAKRETRLDKECINENGLIGEVK